MAEEGNQGEVPQQEPQDISRRDLLKKGLLGLGALIGVGAAGKKFLDETNTTLAIGDASNPESKPWLKIYEGRKDEKVDFEDVTLPAFLQRGCRRIQLTG